MDDVLARIVTTKREEIAARRAACDVADLARRAHDLPSPPDFLAALRGHATIRVIAEIKRASPSAGIIRPDFDPPSLASSYAAGGAACLSVLTDEPYFHGHLEHLRAVSSSVALPTLRKDFVLDPVQVFDARLAGAAAVLLIAECLEADRLADLVGLILELGMTPLVELYEPENLTAVLSSGTPLVGVNNRNLRTFVTHLDQTLSIMEEIPADRTVVSESGIKTAADVQRLASAGVHAMLIGETFMRAPDPGAKLAELLAEAGQSPVDR